MMVQPSNNNSTHTPLIINNNSPPNNNENLNFLNFGKKQNIVIKVATLNVCEITEIKSINILDMMNIAKIQILGITETQKREYNTKFLFRDQNDYRAIFHNDDRNPKGKGVGLLISKILSRYIYNIQGYEGRILIVDLQLRKKKKLRIIVYYGMANVHSSEDRILYTKIVDRLIKYVQEGKMRGHEILLLGDFNANYEDYQKYKIKGISDAYNRKIFHNLEEKYNLFDPVRDIFEISEQNPQHTYFARRRDKEIKTI
jgi:exonuclease III